MFRTRYAEFLKMDFPYISFPKSNIMFKKLIQFGADLVALHTLQSEYKFASWQSKKAERSPFNQDIVRFVEGSNGKQMGKLTKNCYQEKENNLYLDNKTIPDGSHFSGLNIKIWEYFVGSYQICYKWLYDRRAKKGIKGKVLTDAEITTFIDLTTSINQTLMIMEQIDNYINDNGGFPL